MKMPRPFLPPRPRKDIFGLFPPMLIESEDEKAARIAAVEQGMQNAFNAAVLHLGEDGARKLLERISRKPRRGKGKRFASDRDAQLLTLLEAAGAQRISIPKLAMRLHSEKPRIYGDTAKAIEAQIRVIKSKRDKERSRQKRNDRLMRMAFRGIRTIAGDAKSE